MAKSSFNFPLLAEMLDRIAAEHGSKIAEMEPAKALEYLALFQVHGGLWEQPPGTEPPTERIEKIVRWWKQQEGKAGAHETLEKVKETASPPDQTELPQNIQEMQTETLNRYAAGKGIGTDNLIRAAHDLFRAASSEMAAAKVREETTLARTLHSVAEGANALAGMERPRPLPSVTLPKDIKEEDQPKPLFRLEPTGAMGELVRQQTVAILSGIGSAGKSTEATVLAILAATRTPSLLNFPIYRHKDAEPGPILWISYEESAGEILSRMKNMWEAILAGKGHKTDAGHNPHDLLHPIDLRGEDPLFGPPDRAGSSGLFNSVPRRLLNWGVMRAAVEKHQPSLVIIDAIASAFTGDHSSTPSVRSFCDALAGVAKESERTSFILLAHSTKGGHSAPKPEDIFARTHISGSGQWTDAVRGGAITLADPDDFAIQNLKSDRRILAVTKSNDGAKKVWTVLKAVKPEPGSKSNRWCGFELDKNAEPLRNSKEIWLPKRDMAKHFPKPSRQTRGDGPPPGWEPKQDEEDDVDEVDFC